jgi:hypothetical protein
MNDKPLSALGRLHMIIAGILYAAFAVAAVLFLWKIIFTKSNEERDRNHGDW